MVVGGIDGIERRECRPAARMKTLRDFHQRILDIGRRERMTVMPFDVATQVERHCLTVRRLVPRLRELRDGLEGIVVGDEAIEYIHRYDHGGIRDIQSRDPPGRLGYDDRL